MRFFKCSVLLLGISLVVTSCGLLGIDNSPAGIQNVSAVANEYDGITITWDALEGVSTYHPQVSESDADPNLFSAWSTIGSTSSTSITYSDGTPGETYYFIVKYKQEGEATYTQVSSENFIVAQAVFPEFAPVLLSDISLTTTTDLPNSSNAFTGNTLQWSVGTDHEDYDKIDGFKIGFRREGREVFSGAGLSFGDDGENWYIFSENDDELSSNGDAYTFNVDLAATYNDDNNEVWQSDNRMIYYKVIPVDSDGQALDEIAGGKKLELFDEIRNVKLNRVGDTVEIRFTGSSLVTYYELKVDLHDADWEFASSGTNTVVLSKSDLEQIQAVDWQNKPLAQTPYMYKTTVIGVPPSDWDFNTRNYIYVTPGKNVTGPFEDGGNSDFWT